MQALKRPAVPQRIKALSWSLKGRVSGTINHVIYIHIYGHIFLCIYCTCAQTRMHSSHYSALTMHRVLLQRKSTGKSARKDRDLPEKIVTSLSAGEGEGACWGSGNAVSLLTRLVLVTRWFCFCFVIERERKWEKEGAVCEERIFSTEVLGLLDFEFQDYDPCMELFWRRRWRLLKLTAFLYN